MTEKLELSTDEHISTDTIEELTNNKGDDEDE